MERKNTLARLAVNTLLVLLLAYLNQGCATTDALLGQDSDRAGYKIAENLRNNVVHITGTVDGKPEYGLGFIVGEKDKELFIVTASHVVRPKNIEPGQSPPESAQIEFLYAKGEIKEARILPQVSEKEFDLAILSVTRPEGFEWKKEAIGHPEFKPSDKVWTIDAKGSWTPTAEPGSISKSDPVQITTSGLKVSRGQSGAPLISKSGIIGMIYDDETDGDSFAYPLKVIKSQVKEWEKPWNLEDNYSDTNNWLWVLLGVAVASLLTSDGGGDDDDNTGTITVSAPAP